MSDMQDDNQIRNNRLVLLTIIGIPVMMILTGTWLWYFVINGKLDLVGALGTANQGTQWGTQQGEAPGKAPMLRRPAQPRPRRVHALAPGPGEDGAPLPLPAPPRPGPRPRPRPDHLHPLYPETDAGAAGGAEPEREGAADQARGHPPQPLAVLLRQQRGGVAPLQPALAGHQPQPE